MMQWLSSFMWASLSCAAAVTAAYCWFRVRKLLQSASARSLAQLNSEVAELMCCVESMQAQQKKLSARVGMREVRERRAEEHTPVSNGETAPLGETKVPRDKLREIARARGFNIR